MLVSLVLLASVGILMTSFVSSIDDEEHDLEGSDLYDHDLMQDDITSFDDPSNDEIPELNNGLVAEVDSQIGLEGAVSGASEISPEEVVSEVSGSPDSPIAELNVFTLNLSSNAFDDGSAPLDDFNSNPNTPILNIDEFDYIRIDLAQGTGSVGMLRADYLERSESEEDTEVENLHTGVNFYFIPNGEHFPDDYIWSSDAATLYNENSYINDSADFGGIRLILRVETGFLHNVPTYDAGLEFSDEMFGGLDKSIVGDGISQLA